MTFGSFTVTHDTDPAVALWERCLTAAQYLLPQHLLSRWVHRATRCEIPVLKNTLIRWFIRHFDVDLRDAAQPDPARFASFNDFFTRALQPGARPLAQPPDRIVCPVDGFLSRCGRLQDGLMVQAKGRMFAVAELLGDATAAPEFDKGLYATLYLSPRDYHRIHMPLAGRLRQMIYVPGDLFAVNPPATRCVPRLFARNERVVTLFDTAAGTMACVLVGALLVGSMETVWAGEITPRRPRALEVWTYGDDSPSRYYDRGAEMGRFNMGSTVIVLIAGPKVSWTDNLEDGQALRMGQCLGRVL